MQSVLILRDISGIEFGIECKHRSGLIANSFQFPKTMSAKQTKADRPHFFVLGIGGKCDAPNQVFLLNAHQVQLAMLYKRHIHGCEIPKNTPIASAQLWHTVASGVRA